LYVNSAGLSACATFITTLGDLRVQNLGGVSVKLEDLPDQIADGFVTALVRGKRDALVAALGG